MNATNRRDAGFTLTEMMVASALFSLVTLVAVGILIGTVTTGQRVNAVATATTNAQLVGASIDRGILNSTGFEVTTTAAGELLVARVAGGASALQWTCYAWYYDAAGDGSIRTKTAAPGGPLIVAPSATELASWSLLLERVEPRGSAVFSAAGDTLTVAFDAVVDDNQPVAIEFATAPLPGVTEDASCY